MKILEPPEDLINWKRQRVCQGCRAFIEYNKYDLNVFSELELIPISEFAKAWNTQWWINCIVCNLIINIPGESIPRQIQTELLLAYKAKKLEIEKTTFWYKVKKFFGCN